MWKLLLLLKSGIIRSSQEPWLLFPVLYSNLFKDIPPSDPGVTGKCGTYNQF